MTNVSPTVHLSSLSQPYPVDPRIDPTYDLLPGTVSVRSRFLYSFFPKTCKDPQIRAKGTWTICSDGPQCTNLQSDKDLGSLKDRGKVKIRRRTSVEVEVSVRPLFVLETIMLLLYEERRRYGSKKELGFIQNFTNPLHSPL